MPVSWAPETRTFHLRNDLVSYVMRVHDDGSLGHLHFGGVLADDRVLAQVESGGFAGFANRVGDPVGLEYPTTGSGDFRIPALTVEHADGSTVLALAYAHHRIVPGKPGWADGDLPTTYTEDDAEADTLEITLEDGVGGLAVDLAYTIFRDYPAIARSARIRNDGSLSTRPTARSSSAGGSSACAARSRATATRPPGWPSHLTRARPSSACTGRSTIPCRRPIA